MILQMTAGVGTIVLRNYSTPDCLSFRSILTVGCSPERFEELRARFRAEKETLELNGVTPRDWDILSAAWSYNKEWQKFLLFLLREGVACNVTASATAGMDVSRPDNDAALEAIGRVKADIEIGDSWRYSTPV